MSGKLLCLGAVTDARRGGTTIPTGYSVYNPLGISPAMLADGGGYGVMVLVLDERGLNNK